jgi:hypothetical protein
MGKVKILLALALTFTLSYSSFGQARIIFNTDFGGDAEDLEVLVMLHHYIDKKECDVLAIMCWSTEMYAVSAIDAVNRYCHHPEISK